MHLQSRIAAIILILPLVLILASLTIYPFLNMVYMSFHNYDLAKGGDPKFIGLGNYLAIFQDRLAVSSVEFT
ncbi:MAG: sugar ABC transporter permease, partial [Anaerolineae bacterium]|nr:sugar ABC transporter permease [Anaerolineae bacterium]